MSVYFLSPGGDLVEDPPKIEGPGNIKVIFKSSYCVAIS